MLTKIENDYNLFRKKTYIFILSDGEEISLKFKKVNLPHLIGIGKLYKDDKTIENFQNKKISAKEILMTLKREAKTYDVLKTYPSWNGHLARRMENFTFENLNLLLRQSVVIDFIYNPEKTSNDKAKYIFCAQTQEYYLHLYIGQDSLELFYFPNSFSAEIEKTHNAGNSIQIKISKVIINDGKSIEEINHDYYKKIIKNLPRKTKEINSLNVLIKGKKKLGVDIKDMCEVSDLNHRINEIKNDFNEINNYIPINDFLRLKNNNRIKSFYDNLMNNVYSYI